MDNNHAFQSSKFLRALLVLFFMTVSVQWTFAQLNLNMSRTTLGTVIEQIKTQSKYQFFYDDKLAATAVEKVDVKNASIEDALTAILKGKNISFKVEDNIVYLSEKPQSGQEGNPTRKRTYDNRSGIGRYGTSDWCQRIGERYQCWLYHRF